MALYSLCRRLRDLCQGIEQKFESIQIKLLRNIFFSLIDNEKPSFVMVTLKRRASNLFPYGHLYSFIHSVDCTAQFWCPTTEMYTFIYTLMVHQVKRYKKYSPLERRLGIFFQFYLLSSYIYLAQVDAKSAIRWHFGCMCCFETLQSDQKYYLVHQVVKWKKSMPITPE